MRSLDKSEITIFTPLCGRKDFWPEFSSFLEEEYARFGNFKLILMDTSNSSEFEKEIKSWIYGSSFKNIRYMKHAVGRSGLADERRVDVDKSVDMDRYFLIHKAMCEIYNTMRKIVKTPYVWIIEDDIIPPKDTLRKLLKAMQENSAVVSVSGVYQHRYQKDHVVAWDFDNSLLKEGSGVVRVKGNGFGCVLLKTAFLGRHVFTPDEKFPDFDRAFYHRIDSDEVALLDWGITCKHLSPLYTPEPCPHSYESTVSKNNFNEEDYVARYPEVISELDGDILVTPYDHYVLLGKKIGKFALPLTAFDEEYYLETYEDVRMAIEKGYFESGLQHYLEHGRNEGRYSKSLKSED